MSCKVCGSDMFAPLFTLHSYEIARCQQCQLVQVTNTPTMEELEKIYSADFFDLNKYEDNFAFDQENKRRVKMLERLELPADAKIMDFGCATGEFVNFISEQYTVEGADFSTEAIDAAKAKYPSLKEHFFDLSELQAEQAFQNKYDCITMWDVIEHVPEPIETMQFIESILKPGGIVILSTPNMGALTSKVLGSKWAFMTPPKHLNFFTRKTLKTLLNKTNGEEVRFQSLGKWVNFAFFCYKLNEKFPYLCPKPVLNFIRNSYLSRLNLYVPSADIAYAAYRVG